MIGVRKNHGTSNAATMNSTSRKSTFSDASASASPETRPTNEQRQRDREQLRRARARQARSRSTTSRQDEHHREADEMRADDRQRHELAREARLADEVRVVEHRARRRLQRGGEERPDGEPGEQEERVVAAVRERRLPDDAEDEQVDAHEHDRVRDRPQHAERRAAVLRLQVAPEEVRRTARGSGRGRRRRRSSPLPRRRSRRREYGRALRCASVPSDMPIFGTFESSRPYGTRRPAVRTLEPAHARGRPA